MYVQMQICIYIYVRNPSYFVPGLELCRRNHEAESILSTDEETDKCSLNPCVISHQTLKWWAEPAYRPKPPQILILSLKILRGLPLIWAEVAENNEAFFWFQASRAVSIFMQSWLHLCMMDASIYRWAGIYL